MPRTQFDFDQVLDVEFASQLELDQVKDNNTSPTVFDPDLMNNYALYNLASEAYNAANDSNFTFFSPAGGVPYAEINSDTYSTFASFIYRGTDIWTPTKAYLIASRSKSNGFSYLRILDYSNGGNVIIEYEFTNENVMLYTDLTPLSNLPISTAIFEFQAKRDSPSSGTAQIRAVGLYP